MAHWPTKENKQDFHMFFLSMEKMDWDGPKWGREGLLPANPDLSDILGRTDLDFVNFPFYFIFLDSRRQLLQEAPLATCLPRG